MTYVVLAAWLVQAAAGVALLARWMRHGRRGAPLVLTHLTLNLLGLVLWIVFVATNAVAAAWSAFAVMTVGNGIGDAMLLQRTRAVTGQRTGFFGDYGRAVSTAFRGGFPRIVTFHALFSGVVYFSCLGVCIGASLA